MRVYDYYGSPGPDLTKLKEQVADAAGLTFTYHGSSYIGGYYATGWAQPQRVWVGRNLDALDGELRWSRWAEYELIIEAELTLPDETATPVFLDDLRDSLSVIPGLVHLDRKRPEPPPRRPAPAEPGTIPE